VHSNNEVLVYARQEEKRKERERERERERREREKERKRERERERERASALTDRNNRSRRGSKHKQALVAANSLQALFYEESRDRAQSVGPGNSRVCLTDASTERLAYGGTKDGNFVKVCQQGHVQRDGIGRSMHLAHNVSELQ
jgi:hypothetical protein